MELRLPTGAPADRPSPTLSPLSPLSSLPVSTTLSLAEREVLVRGLPSLSGDPLLQLVGAMRMGAILVAADARIAYLNEAAREALSARIGLALHGDRVVAVAPEPRRRLVAALEQACRAPFLDGAVLLSAREPGVAGRPVRVLSMARIAGPSRHADEGLALLCIGNVRRRTPDATMLAQLFGLTATEAGLMASIASGERLQRSAARRNVSLATVRAQLRNVFVKTGVATQSDLSILAWSVPGLWIN